VNLLGIKICKSEHALGAKFKRFLKHAMPGELKVGCIQLSMLFALNFPRNPGIKAKKSIYADALQLHKGCDENPRAL
jgi:hypothetical protein